MKFILKLFIALQITARFKDRQSLTVLWTAAIDNHIMFDVKLPHPFLTVCALYAQENVGGHEWRKVVQ